MEYLICRGRYASCRVRSMTEGYSFTLLVCSHGVGVRSRSSPGGQVKGQSSQGGSGPARGVQVKGQSRQGGQVQLRGGQVKGQSSHGGVRSNINPAGGWGVRSSRGCQVQPVGGVRSKVNPAREGVRSKVNPAGGVRSSRGCQVQPVGGGKHLAPSCGRYASCVHAGGLSCLKIILFLFQMKIDIASFQK